jgi:dimethylglycine dehydrogenase
MKSHYRVVVIGGGVVGASVLYHLAKMGWSDTLLIERNILTSGSSWHAAGGFHALNADPNIAALQAYTIDLLSEIEKESGQSVGMHMTGGYSVASAPERWEWLQASYRVFQTMGIEDVWLVSPEEMKAACPIMNVDGVLGGLYAAREGYIDPAGTVHAYAKAAKLRGAEVVEHNRVVELNQKPDGTWQVVTEKGTVTADHVVNAAGLWAKQVGRMVGLELPVTPMEHHYLITEPIPELIEFKKEIPFIVDLEGFTYVRQEQKGMLLGIYEQGFKHWNMDGAPWDYGFDLIQEDVDRISNELAFAFERFPVLNRVGIRRWVNGAFTFSPDGNPLVGPVRGKKNYWLACGVMAGFLQGGGVGKSLAEWMIEGEPRADIYGMDNARYGAYASNREYIRQMTGQFYSRRFVMSYPNEQLWAGRPLKTSGAYGDMSEAGCKWGVSFGLEAPLYFAPPGFEEVPTLRRSNAFDIVGNECRKLREGVGMIDITAFSRYEVTGENAAQWLDHVFACKLPGQGRARLAPMLAPDGRLKGDLTVFNWGDGIWWIMGSYYLREWHMRWFHDQLKPGVSVRDVSDDVQGFSISGPNAQKLLSRVTTEDAPSFLGCKAMDVGLLRCKVARLSVVGELGYEINCRASEHATLRKLLLAAGDGLGLVEVGFNAMLSLRLEKSFGIWTYEFRQGYTPGMTGLDRFIDFGKPDFVGREKALIEKQSGAKTVLATLEVDASDADASGYKPVWREGKRVGYVTSGGYGHTVKKSLALALIDREAAAVGTELLVHVVGKERKARVIAPSPYDPEGKSMRAKV